MKTYIIFDEINVSGKPFYADEVHEYCEKLENENIDYCIFELGKKIGNLFNFEEENHKK